MSRRSKTVPSSPYASILHVANVIAIEAPAQRNKHATCAAIPWVLIERLRDDFRRLGRPIDEQIEVFAAAKRKLGSRAVRAWFSGSAAKAPAESVRENAR